MLIPRRRFMVRIASVCLGAVFLFAALPKIMKPLEFASDIANYRLLPGAWINVLALCLHWWELFCAIALQFPSWRRSAAIILAALASVFGLATCIAMVRGLDITCGCFGEHSGKNGFWTLVLDLGTFVLCAFIFFESARDDKNTSPSQPVSKSLKFDRKNCAVYR